MKETHRIYFDNAASTPLDPTVAAAMYDVMLHQFGNPSSIHQEGRGSRSLIEKCRKTVANAIGASIGEIFFTSGGTESNNMALKNAVRDLGVNTIITTKMEHHCVLHTLDRLQQECGVRVIYLPIHEGGVIKPQDLSDTLQQLPPEATTLVSLMHSNNEIGCMIDLDIISDICTEAKVLFHTDTVQTLGYFPIDVSKTKMAFCTGSAHKFYGPKGIGFIYINSDNIIQPYIDGGAQERNMRGGTENIYGIVGLAEALQLSVTFQGERMTALRAVRDYMKAQLQATFDNIRINEHTSDYQHPKVLSVSFPASPKADLLLLNLDIAGISASGGSACSSGVESGSHVLEAMYPGSNHKTVRFSFSHHNTKEEVDKVIAKLAQFIEIPQTA